MLVDTVTLEDADLEILNRQRARPIDTLSRPKRTRNISSHLKNAVLLENNAERLCELRTDGRVNTGNISTPAAPNEATHVRSDSSITNHFHQAYNDWSDLCENTFKKMSVCAVCGHTAYYARDGRNFALPLEKLEIPLSENWAGQVSLHAKDKLIENREKSYYVCSSCYHAKDTDFAYAKMHRTHFEERYLKLYYACLDPKQIDPKYRHYLGFLDITFDFLRRCSGNELNTKVHCLFEMPLISNSIDQRIEHFKCPDLIWKLYQTNLVQNPLYRKYCSLLERPNYQNITIVPPQIIENIVSKAAGRDPRPYLTAEDGETSQLMSDGQMSSVIRTNRDSPYGLTSDQQLQAGFLYAKPRGVDQQPKQISLVCNINDTDMSTNRDISVEAALFPYLFPKGTGFYQGTQSFSKYLKFRFRQLFSPHTLTQEFICVMFQIYTTLLYATDNLRYIIQRDWTKYWTLNPTATEEEAIQDILKHKLPKTTPYSPLWYKNKLYDVQAMTAKHGLPFLFMTLTVDDVSSTKWTEYTDLEEILKQYHPSLTYQNAPAECALLFHHRFTNFFDSYILGKGTDIHLLGRITHYVVRYEMQSRQAMHAHVCLWVHDDDKSRVASEITQEIPGQYDEASKKFTIPEDPLLAKLHNIILTKNQHTCRKGECFVKGKCRYGYPFKVNHETKPVLDDENNRYNYYCPRYCDRNTVPYHPMVRLQTSGYHCYLYFDERKNIKQPCRLA